MLKLNLKIIDKRNFIIWRLYEEGIGISDDKEYKSKEDAIKAAKTFAEMLRIEIKNNF
jgi:hypothetical protein